mgnify:CR=1 FL=1
MFFFMVYHSNSHQAGFQSGRTNEPVISAVFYRPPASTRIVRLSDHETARAGHTLSRARMDLFYIREHISSWGFILILSRYRAQRC